MKNWDDRTLKDWLNVRHGAEASLENLTQMCMLADRMSKRSHAMASDFKKFGRSVSTFNSVIPSLYYTSEGQSDLLSISSGLNTVTKFLDNSSTLSLDQSLSLEIGFLEDLKLLRDAIASTLELFHRFDKYGGDTIQQLENKIQKCTSRLSVAKDQEEKKIKGIIASSKRAIAFQKNRNWLIRETLSEELQLHQRSIYLISRTVKDWASDSVKYGELHTENWSNMNSKVAEMAEIE